MTSETYSAFGQPEVPAEHLDHYATLGVASDASREDIQKAHRKLLREELLHPDNGGDEEQFKRVQGAYDVLANPERRTAYDQSLRPRTSYEDLLAYGPGPGIRTIFT